MSNYHAKNALGYDFPSKKSLKTAIAAGEPVYFTDTSLFANNGTVTVADLPEGSIIVGPNPYTNRAWYGCMKKGKIV
jgi:hypothetical protein